MNPDYASLGSYIKSVVSSGEPADKKAEQLRAAVDVDTLSKFAEIVTEAINGQE